jgi:hypothetical protein
MTANRFHSSRPDTWTEPRTPQDPSMRLRTHGPIQPMQRPGFLARLFGAR